MTDEPTQSGLHSAIAALLETRDAGNAVARALEDRYRTSRTQAMIIDLRAGHAHPLYDQHANSLYERSWDG